MCNAFNRRPLAFNYHLLPLVLFIIIQLAS